MSEQGTRAWSECLTCHGSGLMVVHPGRRHDPLIGGGIDARGLMRDPCCTCEAHYADVDAAFAAGVASGTALDARALVEAARDMSKVLHRRSVSVENKTNLRWLDEAIAAYDLSVRPRVQP